MPFKKQIIKRLGTQNKQEKEAENEEKTTLKIMNPFNSLLIKEEPPGRVFYGPSDFIYDNDYVHVGGLHQHHHHHHHHHQQQHQQQYFDTRSVISEPANAPRQVILQEMPCVVEPPKLIRKYRTTKTTTTTQPNFMLDATNLLNHRSSSIPSDAAPLGNIVTSSTTHEPSGATTKRYFKSSNYTTSNLDQLQQQQQQQYLMQQQQQQTTPRHIIEKKSKSEQYQNDTTTTSQMMSASSASSSSTQQQQQQRTLPVNYNNGNNNTSCIDYSNTHYNSDWTMRHAGIDKPQTQTASSATSTTVIPIFQQPQSGNAGANVAFSSMKVR